MSDDIVGAIFGLLGEAASSIAEIAVGVAPLAISAARGANHLAGTAAVASGPRRPPPVPCNLYPHLRDAVVATQ